MKNILTFAFLALFALSACKKEDPTTPPVSPPIVSGTTIQSSVGIRVVDENDNAVSGAQVTLGTETGTTNQDGILLFSNVQINKERAFVKVIKPGYFFGSRAFKPQPASVENVLIKLLPKTNAGNFSSSAGGTITSADGVKLVFPANAIKFETGGSYTGTVNVAIKHLNPVAADLFEIMPGNLEAIDASGDRKFLETYGMAAIELTTPSGIELNLAAGNTATMSMVVPSQILSAAPSTIPLWYFDETVGIWKEEGSATLIGNEYVGDVSHFSFWNYDVSFNTTTVSGKILCNGVPLQNTRVELLRQNASNRIVGVARTNSLGIFGGLVPTNETFTINVYSNSCLTTPIYTSTIGPFSSASTIPDITACATNNTGTLSGNMTDCNGNTLINGMIEVTFGNSYFYYLYPDANGNINTNITFCASTTVDIISYDFQNGTQSTLQSIPTSSVMNFGTLSTCDTSEYIDYVFDGTAFSAVLNARIFSASGEERLTASDALNNFIHMETLGNTLGTFPLKDSVMVNGYIGSNLTSSNNVNITFTKFGATSGSISKGTFSGTFHDQSSVLHTLSGSFRLKRL